MHKDESECLSSQISFFPSEYFFFFILLLANNLISLPFCSVDSDVMSCINMPMQTARP